MNINNILAVADAIEKQSIANLKFDMSDYGTKERLGCGTAACIAGFAFALADPQGFRNYVEKYHLGSAFDVGMKYLGLDEATARALFCDPSVQPSDVTSEMAVKTLRHLAATGEVVWPEEVYYEVVK
jgi:hypothetical protein